MVGSQFTATTSWLIEETVSHRLTDSEWMLQALVLAQSAVGTTAPNPPVGALLVRDGVLLGSGFTQPVGGNHAEIESIQSARAAGHSLVGATMYVTLEPCGHHGRTQPCTDAILSEGVSRVVVGTIDKNPLMSGRSLEQLSNEGVEIVLGVEAESSERLVRGFSRSISIQLPEVTCKVATSLDGKIATDTGESQWITGEDSRKHSHDVRAIHDAILVGVNTVIADNPRLTCRTVEGRDPVPVILDTHLRTPASSQIFAGSKTPIIYCGEDAPSHSLPCEIVRVPKVNGLVSVEHALSDLAARGLHRILVEGGATIHRSMIESGLVDTLMVYMAGVVIPGGRSWLGGDPVSSLEASKRFGKPTVTSLGNDLLLTYELTHRLDRVS